MDWLRRTGIEYVSGESLACRASKSQIDHYSTEVATALGFQPGQDVQSVVERLGGRIHYESAFAFLEEDATILVHGPNDFDIALTNLGWTRRDTFTLAHELGHYLLHSRQGNRPMEASRKGSNRVEWEANWFAAGFLMPARKFRQLASQGRDQAHIANVFGVSLSAVAVRMSELGI